MSSLPCVGCGWCCLDNPCEVSHRLYGYVGRCPDLCWDAGRGRYLCGLAAHPELGAGFRAELFVGQGCCAPLNAWREDVRERG
jgi:hypothetical protein